MNIKPVSQRMPALCELFQEREDVTSPTARNIGATEIMKTPKYQTEWTVSI